MLYVAGLSASNESNIWTDTGEVLPLPSKVVFDINGDFTTGSIYDYALDSKGSIYFAGSFTAFNGKPTGFIAEYTKKGYWKTLTPDTPFDTSVGNRINTIETFPEEGSILIGLNNRDPVINECLFRFYDGGYTIVLFFLGIVYLKILC